MKTKFLVVAFCLAVFAVGLVTSDVAESRALSRNLGGVNLAGYCQQVVKYSGAELVANNVYGWRCWKNEGEFKYWTEITVTGACQWQYKNRYAYARYRSYSNPYSWYCND